MHLDYQLCQKPQKEEFYKKQIYTQSTLDKMSYYNFTLLTWYEKVELCITNQIIQEASKCLLGGE